MVELAALEKRYGETHQGFESLSLRQIKISPSWADFNLAVNWIQTLDVKGETSQWLVARKSSGDNWLSTVKFRGRGT